MFRPRIRTLLAAGIGAAAAYLWDPEQGEQRRAKITEQFRSMTASTGQSTLGPWTDTPATDPAPTDAPVARESLVGSKAGNGAS